MDLEVTSSPSLGIFSSETSINNLVGILPKMTDTSAALTEHRRKRVRKGTKSCWECESSTLLDHVTPTILIVNRQAAKDPL
jgi:hypothetical protein